MNDQIVEWNGKVDEKRGNKFPILPTMAKMFKDTKLVSSNLNLLTNLERHVRFYQLIKSSKKKRIEKDEKLNEEMKEKKYIDYIDRQKDQIEDLKSELNDYKARLEERQKDTDLLNNLYSSGFIGIDGNTIDRRS